MRRRISMAAVLVAGVVAASTIALQANVLLQFSPEAGGGIPGYARLERVDGVPLVHHDATWAAITFYRDPSCIPADFNLLDMFDPARAFDCTLTVQGFEIWRNGPWAGDDAPIQTVSFGLGAVPVWFVSWTEMQAVMSDDIVTIGELEACASLRKGSASAFKETLHPSGGPAAAAGLTAAGGPSGDGAQQTKTEIVASGTFADSTGFFFQVEETHNLLKHVVIEFK